MDIKIPMVPGLVCLRAFSVKEDATLFSPIKNVDWEKAELKADAKPTFENDNGIYAYGLTFQDRIRGYDLFLIGIVELRGDMVKHFDGVWRGEFCKILHIISPLNAFNQKIAEKYGIPVTQPDKIHTGGVPIDRAHNNLFCEYAHWLGSPNGVEHLQANNSKELMLPVQRGTKVH